VYHVKVSWKSAALRIGEELGSLGPQGYYEMTPAEWLSWALVTLRVVQGDRNSQDKSY